MSDDGEIVAAFLAETAEGLDRLETDLVALEADPTSPALLAGVFRTFHTVKGTSGFLGFRQVEDLSHAAEDFLGELRDGNLQLTRAHLGGLLEVVDALRSLLGAIRAGGAEDDRDHEELLARLAKRGDERPAPPVPPPPRRAAAGPGTTGTLAERSVRVDVELLDRILRRVGELVLARNQLAAHRGARGGGGLDAPLQRLSALLGELQADVSRTRMQPIGQLLAKLPRLVRDLAGQCGKSVRLDLDGGDTELDRSVLEAVRDPLVHLVRNAVDHGLEMPAARTDAGKDPTGRVAVRARHEQGQVVLEVTDDGAGIDPERVGRRAVERGLIAPAELASLSEAAILELVFTPGFSTAAAVTTLSGRGVGMDVVRANVERIGGAVGLHSVPGAGTTVRARIPLTLAIVPALLVSCRGSRYALPQASVLELARLGDAALGHPERVEDTVVARRRDEVLPLARLDELLGLGGAGREAPGTVAVVQSGEARLGVVVDGVIGTEEIVVVPLGRHLRHLGAYAGATVLGDGAVALVLDVAGLAPPAGRSDVA